MILQEKKKKEAEIEATRTEWQPMGTTCKVKAKNLAQYAMLYSGKMYHVHKETFQKVLHRLTLRSPFTMEELMAMRDAVAEVGLHMPISFHPLLHLR